MAMRLECRIALEELCREGRQESASQAAEAWDTGIPWLDWPKLRRYTAALVSAANWEIERASSDRISEKWPV